jgi:hypothetical protein
VIGWLRQSAKSAITTAEAGLAADLKLKRQCQKGTSSQPLKWNLSLFQLQRVEDRMKLKEDSQTYINLAALHE